MCPSLLHLHQITEVSVSVESVLSTEITEWDKKELAVWWHQVSNVYTGGPDMRAWQQIGQMSAQVYTLWPCTHVMEPYLCSSAAIGMQWGHLQHWSCVISLTHIRTRSYNNSRKVLGRVSN